MQIDKKWRLALVVFGAVFLLAPLVFLSLALDNQAAVQPDHAINHDDVKRIKRLIKIHNPFYLRRNEVKTMALTEPDVNLLLNYGVSYALKKEGLLFANTEIRKGEANIRYTQTLPPNPFGRYINVHAQIRTSDGKWSVHGVTLGSIAFPGWLTMPVAMFAHRWAASNIDEYGLVAAAIQKVELLDGRVLVRYQWRADVASNLRDKGRARLMPEDERERIIVYYNHLALKTHQFGKNDISTIELVRPMFQLANQRIAGGENIHAESRALLISLALYLAEVDTKRILGSIKNLPTIHPRHIDVRLRDRHDLLQHFFVSAALRAAAGQRIADVLGLAKEMDDSMGGSGFSFADLLADRAGVRFAEALFESEARAASIHQAILAETTDETYFMPTYEALPEGLTEEEFKANYHNIESDTYRRVEDDIATRIAALPIYREYGQAKRDVSASDPISP